MLGNTATIITVGGGVYHGMINGGHVIDTAYGQASVPLVINETAKITASDGAIDDWFGYSVSVYNTTAVIGAYRDDDNGSNSGSAYVFEKNSTSGNWTQKQKLLASDGAIDDWFGRSVSVYNNIAVIGAIFDDDNGSNSGSAYVFSVDTTSPTPVITTTAADPTNLEPIPFTVDFGVNMTSGEFVAAGITLSSGTVTDFTPDSANQLFTFNATDADDGEDLTVDVAANVATDLAGNNNTAADQLSVTVDRTAPTPVITTTAANYTNLEIIPFTVDFGVNMTSGEFAAAEITLSSGTVTDFTPDSANQLFTFNATDADDGEDLTVDVAANVATDLAGNNNTAADQLSVTVDRTAPTLQNVTISSNNTNSTLAANGDTVTLSFTASESITDVTATISNATATVSGSGTSWNATRALDGTEPQGALPFTINFDDLAGNPGVQVNATTDSSAVTVTILDTDGSGVTNQTPTANAGDDQTVGEGTKKVTLDGTGSTDPDGDTITYAWSQTRGPTVTLSSSTSASPTFDAPLINSTQTILTFFLTVNDGAVDSTPDTVDITVLDTDDVLLTSPGSPSGSSGSSSSGIGISGGGGGGGSSTWVDDIYLKSVSWDCNAGTIKIIAGPDSDYISVAVHTTQLGIHQASIAGDDIPGYRAFVSPMHKTEDYINIKAVALSGRNLVTISESIDVDACVGERTYHAPDDSTTTTIKQPVPKQEDDKDRLADFVDPKKNPQYYIDRYNNEIEYREWFDENYPGITIYEAVGLPVPDPTLEPAVEQEPTAVEQEPTAVEQEPAMKQEPEPICGPGTELVDGFCIPLTPGPEENGGGCLIATAAYGTELAPQVQLLREIRDNAVLQTQSGSAFMDSFNSFYYSFSPSIADLERQNPVFREAVKMAVTPLISSLAILDYVDIDSESEMLGYGIGIVAMNIAMYVALPVSALYYVRRLVA